ncbi:MAG: hypothetical protein LBV23_04470, partial [Deltaproteobacteria bacterium]|nr:hypothetical protein [Deltaproteobacteria bacterium]
GIETKINEVIDSKKDDFFLLLKTYLIKEIESLYLIIHNKLEAWLKTFGLRLAQPLALQTPLKAPLTLIEPYIGDRLALPLLRTFEGLVSAISSLSMAAICGGGGLALLAHGPAGLAMGAAAGLALSTAGLFWGREKVKSLAKKQRLPKFIIKLIISDTKINNLRIKLLNDINNNIDNLFDNFINNISTDINNKINYEIDRLSIVNFDRWADDNKP